MDMCFALTVKIKEASMLNAKQRLGKTSESVAVKHLKKNGYKIIERNYRNKIGEIDIIARKNDILCFIEVKTRQNTRKGLPKESVTISKQRKITLGALSYLKEKRLSEQRIRFDVIEIFRQGIQTEINHI